MNRKMLLIIFIILISTGCSVKYNIKIDRHMKVTETVTALESADFYSQYEKSSTRRVISFLLDNHLDFLNNNNYEVENVLGDESGVNIKHTYNTLDDYMYSLNQSTTNEELNDNANYSKYRNLGSNPEYNKEGNIITLKFEGNVSGDTQNQEIYKIDDAELSITLPFKVIENNADKYDSSTKTYTWNVGEEKKEIYIKFDKSKLQIDYLKYIIIGVVIIALIIVITRIINLIEGIASNNSKRNEI